MDNIIVLPYTFNRSLNSNNPMNNYVIKAKTASATTEALTRLDAFLSGMFPVNEYGYSDYGDYYVQSDNSYADSMESQSIMQSLVLGAIAGISLLVGGIGIMNIMLVSVTERTREIGIRKSLGAKGRDIMSQFVIEAATVSGMGGIVGIVLGAVLAIVFGNMLNLSATPSVGAVLLSFSVSVGIGILFGYLPAKNAAKLNPIDALRHD
jgi:putative ABC transport system permease protein